MWADTLVGLGMFLPVGLLIVVMMVKDLNKVKLTVFQMSVVSCLLVLFFSSPFTVIYSLVKNTKPGWVQWRMPVFEKPRWEDRLRLGVQDQPGKHSETPSLQKMKTFLGLRAMYL